VELVQRQALRVEVIDGQFPIGMNEDRLLGSEKPGGLAPILGKKAGLPTGAVFEGIVNAVFPAE
jgi:hypothetical protein